MHAPFAIPVVLLSAATASAQLAINTYTFEGGGRSTGANLVLAGAVGQPDAGLLAGGSLLLSGGFFHPILGSTCYANCDASTAPPILNVDDFTCFINQFAMAQALPHAQQIVAYANCDASTIAPVLNVDDFTCFINAFALGCP